MKPIFLWLWLLASLLFLGGMVAHELIVQFYWGEEEVAYWEQFYLGGFRLAAEEVAGSDDIAATEAHLEQVLEVEAVVLSAAEFPAPGVLLFPNADGPGGWTIDRDGEYYYVSTSHPDRMLRLGPYMRYPMPYLPPRLLVLAMGVVSFAGLFWMGLRPLHRSQRALSRVASAIAGGDLSARVAPAEMAAAPTMADSFNHMAERIEALIAEQRSVLRVASHEIRTPIARLRIGAHLLAGDTPQQQERLRTLERDLEELDALVDEVLMHARLESGGESQRPEPVRLAPILDALIEDAARLHPALGVSLDEAAWQAPPVLAVPTLLQRAVGNLLSNATRYAAAQITVGVTVEDAAVLIRVADDGPGIPEAERERVLRPFVRLGEQGQHGMGLAIVDRIMTFHGGGVQIEDSVGCAVTLRWPRRPPQEPSSS